MPHDHGQHGRRLGSSATPPSARPWPSQALVKRRGGCSSPAEVEVAKYEPLRPATAASTPRGGASCWPDGSLSSSSLLSWLSGRGSEPPPAHAQQASATAAVPTAPRSSSSIRN